MEKFVVVTAPAGVFDQANIDTDQIFPARHMKQPRSAGYDNFLFRDQRFDAEGRPVPGFPLNRPRSRPVQIILAGRNFGCGSSREAAVYALVDYGIRCVLAPSFGDIFSANAVNNGLLPARIGDAEQKRLATLLGRDEAVATVDLRSCKVTVEDEGFAFQIDPVWRLKLLNGWDDVDITRTYDAEIQDWLRRDGARRPWAYLRGTP